MTSRPLSVGGCARRVLLCVGLAGLALPAAGTVPLTVSAELARCAALTAAEERLACYDALAKPKPPDAQTSPGDAVRPKSSATDTQSFGLSPRQLPATPEGPKLITALVTRVTVDRAGNVLVSLDNGQTWTFKDEDMRLKSGDRVTIRRAAFGSFLMTTPARQTHRVQRTQ